jgi:hypothetical protein
VSDTLDPDNLWSNERQLEELAGRTLDDLRRCSLTAQPDDARVDRVGSLLRSVVANLSSAKIGYRMAARLNVDQGAQLRHELGGADWNTVEHAAMSLAVEDVITAMELCGAIIQSLVGEPTRWGNRVWTLKQCEDGRIPVTWAPLQAWLDNLRAHQHYERLTAWRHAMVHRGYEKIELSGEAGIVGTVNSEWREPSTIFVRPNDDGPHVTFDLPSDLATCVLLGVREFRAFCVAISEVAVAHPLPSPI